MKPAIPYVRLTDSDGDPLLIVGEFSVHRYKPAGVDGNGEVQATVCSKNRTINVRESVEQVETILKGVSDVS